MHQPMPRTLFTKRAPTGLEWGDVLTCAATHGAPISRDEVNDVCLLLMLAERVFIPRLGREHSAARRLSCVLHELMGSLAVAD